ncbi:hypothetical protein Tco_0632866, partial [Tanacetum coccineum]
ANITAVDVVNFGIQDHNFSGRKDMLLQAFVALVDNGRYLYAPTGSHDPLTKNLSSSPIMPTAAAASFEEDDIQPLGMNKVVIPHKNKKKHRNKNKPVVQPHNGIRVSELVASH